ncbi:peritrophin-44-like [Eupeodes corollae]|uniref:peritrophin-44-like n=1 Tax=Eupeodes corollae TaxID=290404 RepID=UPI00249339DD|nr:peritrophin-44-like [Eupeodes corollae]
MKGSSIIRNAAIQLSIFAIIALVPQTKALTAEQTCPLVKNNTYIGDPNDCQGWVFCTNGKAIYGKCNDNLFFDSANGVCDYPENVACNLNVETMCAGLTDIYKSDPNDCSKYCYCKDGETKCNKCPSGQFFDPNTISCVWATSSSCVANSPCLLAPNGFIGDGKTCTGYLRCGSSRVLSSGNCEEDRYYNPLNGMCDYPENVKCPGSPSKPPVSSEHIPPKDLCKKDGQFYSDGETCRGYFYCKNKGDTAKWGQCPKNSQFNEATQQCNDPEKVLCTKDRCDGTSKSFMAVANTNCKQYFNCNKGVENGQGTCPKDHPYYNEKAGVCQTDKLDYPICS